MKPWCSGFTAIMLLTATGALVASCGSESTSVSDGLDRWPLDRPRQVLPTAGTVAVKMDSSSTTSEGRMNLYVPASNTMTTNGGGHAVVPRDGGGLLAISVAPRLFPDETYALMLEDEFGWTPGDERNPDEVCSGDENNCFFSYLYYHEEYGGNGDESNPYPVYPPTFNELHFGSALQPHVLTRIGITTLADSGSSNGHGYRWIAEDDDCQLSDPQLVDMKNGRFLLGYARFQCISDEQGYHRNDINSGSHRMLVPKEYVLLEIDAEGNPLTPPAILPNHGWGGLDEMVLAAPGRVVWTYLPDPNITSWGGGQRDTWELMEYTSAF